MIRFIEQKNVEWTMRYMMRSEASNFAALIFRGTQLKMRQWAVEILLMMSMGEKVNLKLM